jgi:hypothetical protein
MKKFYHIIFIFIITTIIIAEDNPSPSGATESSIDWRVFTKKYSNGTITFLFSGNLQWTENLTEFGGNLSGTGNEIGLGDQGRLCQIASYINSKQDGVFITFGGDKLGPHDLILDQYSIGKNLLNSDFLWNHDGKLLLNGSAVQVAEVNPSPSGATESAITWRVFTKKFSNETITFIVSGKMQWLEILNESEDHLSGTGNVIGIDDQGRLRLMASYINSKLDGISIHVSGDKLVPGSLDWDQFSNGKNIIHSHFTWSHDGKLLLNGVAVPIDEK